MFKTKQKNLNKPLPIDRRQKKNQQKMGGLIKA